jgi:uncharacterized protein (TIGR02453 family)
MHEFSGFDIETVVFLRDLSQNNNKVWFDGNRRQYEAHYIKPAIEFVTAVGEPLRDLEPGLHAEARVNGSIFRINRDIRFSRDKTPYKDHLDLWFWEGERKGAISGLFFRLTKDRLILGAGAHGFGPQQLAAYRDTLNGNRSKALALLGVESDLEESGLALKGEHYKSVPHGLDIDEPRLVRLARFNALHSALETGHPAILATPKFVEYCIDSWRKFVPLHKWLVRM